MPPEDANEFREIIDAWGHRGVRLLPLVKKRPVRGFTAYHGVGGYPAAKLDGVRDWQAVTHLGLVLPPDIIVLDIDVKGGKQGFHQLADLEAEYGPLPDTLKRPTPSGGEHRYFRVPEGHAGMRWRSAAEWRGHTAAESAIDILHAGNRYAVLYDVEAVLGHLQEIEELPVLWLLPLCRRVGSPVRAELGDAQVGVAAATALQRIETLRGAPEGSRHNQLRVTALDLLKYDPDGGTLRSLITDAAMSAGLPRTEVMNLMDSVTETLNERHGRVYGWTRWACAEIEQYPVRNRPRLRLAIMCIAHTCIAARKEPTQKHGVTLWLSARTLAFLMGVTPATAAALIQRLRSMGILLRVDSEAQEETVPAAVARTYRLAGTKSDVELNIQTLVGGSCNEDVGMYKEASSPLPLASTQMRLALADHNAFRNRRDGVPVLPVACADLLLAMMSDQVHKSDVAQRLGVHAQTARRYRATLRAAGVITEDSDGFLALVSDDVLGMLDTYAQTVMIPDRRESQVNRIRNERLAYQQSASASRSQDPQG